jgi:rubrerythrin
MDILEQAMKIEKQGEMLYRAFAQDASDKGAIYIFSWLADQEKKHYDIFKRMKEDSPVSYEKDSLFKAVLSVFSGWMDARARLDVKTTQVDLYRIVLGVEEESVRLYEEGAKKADDDKMKSIFLQIAGEEKVHQRVMEHIIEFVTKPEIWFENAEFGYRGEDYYL